MNSKSSFCQFICNRRIDFQLTRFSEGLFTFSGSPTSSESRGLFWGGLKNASSVRFFAVCDIVEEIDVDGARLTKLKTR